MDEKDPATLLDLAIQTLLTNEPVAIQALEELPRELFIPLFNAAFKGGHKKILIAMVKVWPFYCLHIGELPILEPQRKLLEAMVENLQFLPSEDSGFRNSKLRVLDLRQDAGCKTTCPKINIKSPVCLHSCAYSENSVLQREAWSSAADSKSKSQSLMKPMELLVDLSFDETVRERMFFTLLLKKVQDSSRSLHLCCRDLQIEKLADFKSLLSFLDLKCVDHLAVDEASLSDVTNLLSTMVHLEGLNLSKITYGTLNGKVFRNFLNYLRNMNNLKELHLSYFCLTNHLESVLRVLKCTLDFLYLPFCHLSYNDFRFLSQWPQGSLVKHLNVSNNPMYWEDCVPFSILLENVSGTLQHLAINHCLLTDSTIAVLLPSLSHCSHLHVLSFAANPITMPMLIRILQCLTHLMELKYVIYPIPMHCYERWHFQGSLDQQKLADVKNQLKMKLQAAQRDDMNWVTFPE